ncbi:MAG TPA: 50S ribosomal protein L22 [Thermodesulfobacteriota bacterium]|nr:50S ribosomal protein L22 [Thermodesulfobacteriota bacterium]
MAEVRARLRYLRIAPRKTRLVVDLVRGKRVDEALRILQFTHRAASLPVMKLIKSAVANASQNEAIDVDTLVIKDIQVGPGPTLKRYQPRAMGRAFPIHKRTSHVTVVLAEQ